LEDEEIIFQHLLHGVTVYAKPTKNINYAPGNEKFNPPPLLTSIQTGKLSANFVTINSKKFRDAEAKLIGSIVNHFYLTLRIVITLLPTRRHNMNQKFNRHSSLFLKIIKKYIVL
jgi:hypothetical protein